MRKIEERSYRIAVSGVMSGMQTFDEWRREREEQRLREEIARKLETGAARLIGRDSKGRPIFLGTRKHNVSA